MISVKVKQKNGAELSIVGESVQLGRIGTTFPEHASIRGFDPLCKKLVCEGDDGVSRHQMYVASVGIGQVRVVNLSKKNAIHYQSHRSSIAPQTEVVLSVPVLLVVGTTEFSITTTTSRPPTQPPSLPARPATMSTRTITSLGPAPTPERITGWFREILAVLRSARSSEEFYADAARVAVDLVGLDAGVVLLFDGKNWKARAEYLRPGVPHIQASKKLLDEIVATKTAFCGIPPGPGENDSLMGVRAVAVAPILDSSEDVIGVVYGVRLVTGKTATARIDPLEREAVECLAAAVGVGHHRKVKEAEAETRLSLLRQFFSADLASEFLRTDEWQKGRRQLVTVMFADIRNFTPISRRLDPDTTCVLIHDVMDRLSARVHEFGGVVVDFLGDGLVAMWNAPRPQKDHAQRACNAGLAILGEVERLREVWSARLPKDIRFDVGVGINTGEAIVGNIGSNERFKYGPLGFEVNLAARVETATKQLGTRLLVTQSTLDLTDQDTLSHRRIGQFRLVGAESPIQLHELWPREAAESLTRRGKEYEDALVHYERGEYDEAIRRIGGILRDTRGGYDGPSLFLLEQAVSKMREPVDGRPSPVFILDRK